MNKVCKCLAITLLALVTLSFAEKQSTTPQVKKDPVKKSAPKIDTLVINARLIEIPGTLPSNEIYNYVYIMKYQVLSVENGVYTEKEILVGQYNPLMSRRQIKDNTMKKVISGNVEKFELGAKHKLTLISPMERVWNKEIEDEYLDSSMEKYLAIKSDILTGK
jgi:hypothetical protein